MKKYLLIFNTVRHLRPCQITGQIRNRLRTRFENPSRLLSLPIPTIGSCQWPEEIEILPPGMQLNSADDMLAGKLTVLNSTQQMGWMPDWNSDTLPKLWLYNLHYFEWLWALDYEDAKAVTLDWISNHEPAKGRQGWEPYPISLRVMNLCGVFCGKFKWQVEGDEELKVKLWESVYRQCQWLMRHLETHLLGNHYLENGAALAFVGSCFDGDAADRWLDKGVEILQEQIPEQILTDGMHFELSPMYHSRMLYLMGILSATGNKQLTKLVDEPMRRMAKALAALCHPDGQIALFNDSAFGVYNEPRDLLAYVDQIGGQRSEDRGSSFAKVTADKQGYESGVDATALQSAARNPINHQPSTIIPAAFSLPDAGYYGWRDERGNYLVCDFGQIGPDYQPGHVHADFGSYELSLNGHRVIVDSGVHDYEPSNDRKYSRSTAAHNTVEINGQDQCEVWGTFRVARRGVPQDVEFVPSENGFKLSGSHNGYKRLPGKPVHSRRVDWHSQSICLKICDKVRSMTAVKAVSRIHLHPGCTIQSHSERVIKINYPAGVFLIEVLNPARISIGEGLYFPEFGKKVKNTVIEIQTEGLDSEIKYKVQPCA